MTYFVVMRRTSRRARGIDLGREVLEGLEQRHAFERAAAERQPVQQVAVAHVTARAERGMVERVLTHVDAATRRARARAPPRRRTRTHTRRRACAGRAGNAKRGTRLRRRAWRCACTPRSRCRAWPTGSAGLAVVALGVEVVVQRAFELARADLAPPAGTTANAPRLRATHGGSGPRSGSGLSRPGALGQANPRQTELHVDRERDEAAGTGRVHHLEVRLLFPPVVDRALVERLDRERDEIRAVEQRDALELERTSRRRRRRAERRPRGCAVFVP